MESISKDGKLIVVYKIHDFVTFFKKATGVDNMLCAKLCLVTTDVVWYHANHSSIA